MRENNIVWGVGRGPKCSKLCAIFDWCTSYRSQSQYGPGLERVSR